MKMVIRLSAVVVACLFAAPASAGLCFDATTMFRILAEQGKRLAFTAAMHLPNETAMPLYLAKARNGHWTLFYMRNEVFACPLFEGTAWTDQSEIIPRADIHP